MGDNSKGSVYKAWWEDILALKKAIGISVDGGDDNGGGDESGEDAKTILERLEALEAADVAAMHYKGTVATQANLPTADNAVGDFYNVTDSSKNFAWNGSSWDDVTGIFSVSTATDSVAGIVKLNDVMKATKWSGDGKTWIGFNEGNRILNMKQKPLHGVSKFSWDGDANLEFPAVASGTTETIATESLVSTAKTELTTAVSDEATRAKAAEKTNADAITAETTRAKAAEALLAPKASPTFTGTATAATLKATTVNVSGATSTSSLTTTGAATVGGALTCAKGATVTGDLKVNGSTTLGDASTDKVAVNATPTVNAPATFAKAITGTVAQHVYNDGNADYNVGGGLEVNSDITVAYGKRIYFTDSDGKASGALVYKPTGTGTNSGVAGLSFRLNGGGLNTDKIMVQRSLFSESDDGGTTSSKTKGIVFGPYGVYGSINSVELEGTADKILKITAADGGRITLKGLVSDGTSINGEYGGVLFDSSLNVGDNKIYYSSNGMNITFPALMEKISTLESKVAALEAAANTGA